MLILFSDYFCACFLSRNKILSSNSLFRRVYADPGVSEDTRFDADGNPMVRQTISH